MRITCPSCAASYQIKPNSVGADGKTVRCAKCKTDWFVNPHVEALPPAPDPPVVDVGEGDGWNASGSSPMAPAMVDMAPPAAVDRSVLPHVRSVEEVAARRAPAAARKGKAKGSGFAIDPGLIGFGVIILLIGTAILFRTPIVRHVPNSASLFARIGLPVNLRGISFHDVVTRTEYEGGQPVVIVEGRIQNIAGATLNVPRMRIVARSMTGGEIYAWTLAPRRPLLGPRESVTFRTKFPNPPTDTHDVVVRFVTPRDKPTPDETRS